MRMQLLKDSLNHSGISAQLLPYSNTEKLPDAEVLLLDARDEAFPDLPKDTIKVAVDNRGIGRKQADYIWDTLPHPAMTVAEFKTSLKQILFPPQIYSLRGKKTGEIFLAHNKLPAKKGQPTKQKDYLHQVSREKLIHTYFGQTLFEAIYMGTNAVLHPITPYHALLNKWIYQKAKANKISRQYFDGKGLVRLTDFLKNLIVSQSHANI